MKIIPITTSVLILLAAPAIAGSIDVSGTGHGTATNTAMPVSEDLVVVHANTEYTGFEGDNPDNPMTSFKGPCFGSILIKAGVVSGGGNCQYTDGDGEMAVVTWNADGMSAEGRTQGTWEIVGGSGKWAAANGGGRFDAGTDDQGGYTNKVTGEINMP
ncbi:hypothetical protein SAMN05444004_11466 [Jannaschia faecimaris]|uniref:Uncharacterized protein n=1 Tax=Jannaschia faecimaris TaxID=1244108 RepID=A0A1H3T008_9RHOB|nr:hypothetical protein [Jannaschia faecimaris]SDZ43218.1 hypothetical protein SAMN05444004_11466 [Jannaschia faecimaris]